MIGDAAQELETQWRADDRWSGIQRTYSAEDVVRLRGSVVEERTLARLGAERLWQLIQADRPARALGAPPGGGGRGGAPGPPAGPFPSLGGGPPPTQPPGGKTPPTSPSPGR